MYLKFANIYIGNGSDAKHFVFSSHLNHIVVAFNITSYNVLYICKPNCFRDKIFNRFVLFLWKLLVMLYQVVQSFFIVVADLRGLFTNKCMMYTNITMFHGWISFSNLRIYYWYHDCREVSWFMLLINNIKLSHGHYYYILCIFYFLLYVISWRWSYFVQHWDYISFSHTVWNLSM